MQRLNAIPFWELAGLLSGPRRTVLPACATKGTTSFSTAISDMRGADSRLKIEVQPVATILALCTGPRG